MKTRFAAVLVLAVANAAAASQQQSSPPAPEQQQQISKMPAMSEDRRVKAEGIDSVMSKDGVILLDVRDPNEIEELGGYEGAINIPVTQLERRLGELPKDKTILTACNGGGRASRAAAILEKNGFKVAGFCGLREYKGPKAKPPKKAGG